VPIEEEYSLTVDADWDSVLESVDNVTTFAKDVVQSGLGLSDESNVQILILSVGPGTNAFSAFADSEIVIDYVLRAKSEEALEIVTSNMAQSIGTSVVVDGLTIEFASNDFVSTAPTGIPTPSPTRRPKKCSSDSECRKNMRCDVYNGICVEPTPSPTASEEEEEGCCVSDSAYASSKWHSRCKEAETENECLRFGRGSSERCDWRSGPDANCDDVDSVEGGGHCAWNMVGKGDPDRLNKQCSRLDRHNCESGGPKGFCMWVPDAPPRAGNSFLAMVAAKTPPMGFAMSHRMLMAMAMSLIAALFAVHRMCRKCRQRADKSKYGGYSKLPDAADDQHSSYYSMAQSV